MPWLVVSSLRFAARNSSYRNVRFNFNGTLGQAAWAYIAWPVFSALTFGALYPLGRRARDYFYVNNHTFGGKPFHTAFGGWPIYKAYLIGFGTFLAGVSAIATFVVLGITLMGGLGRLLAGELEIYHFTALQVLLLMVPAYLGGVALIYAVPQIVSTMVFNLAVSNATLNDCNKLRSTVPPFGMAAVVINNLFFTAITLGLYYPWARTILVEYQLMHMQVILEDDPEQFTSEAIATQGAIGEEIAGFFDLGIGL